MLEPRQSMKQLADAYTDATPPTAAPMTRRRALGAALAVAAAGALPGQTQAQRAPLVDADRAFAGLSNRIDQTLTDIRSLVVQQQGRVRFEYHRRGYNANTLQDWQSCTKSVLSLLVGQALGQGKVRRLDQSVATFLPEMMRLSGDARVRALTLENLLTMQAGWPAQLFAQRNLDDSLPYIVTRPFEARPGTRFIYDNGAANLLALAMARAVGQPLGTWAREQLFAPLGINAFEWPEGANGHGLGAQGLRLGTRDALRIGQLVLDDGRAGARELVPADYVVRATRPQNAGGPPVGSPYGYLWWIGSGAGGPPVMASGYGGQWIWIDRAQALVVVATSATTPQSMARGQAITLIRRDIASAVRGPVRRGPR